MMNFEGTELPGLYLIRPFVHEDSRGTFVKTFHQEVFAAKGIKVEWRESFYSTSMRGVIRGMHFQSPPMQHSKLVFCTHGSVLDVIVDLRKGQPTYGQYQAFRLSAQNREMLFIPEGMAHGFCAQTDEATLFYFTSREHSPAHDMGIRYDSFGFHWPVENPILSPRDAGFPTLAQLETPFQHRK